MPESPAPIFDKLMPILHAWSCYADAAIKLLLLIVSVSAAADATAMRDERRATARAERHFAGS